MTRRASRSIDSLHVKSPVEKRIATAPAHLPVTVVRPSGASDVRPSTGLPPTRISRSAYFLHGEYKPEYYYWECVDLLRRLALVGLGEHEVDVGLVDELPRPQPRPLGAVRGDLLLQQPIGEAQP